MKEIFATLLLFSIFASLFFFRLRELKVIFLTLLLLVIMQIVFTIPIILFQSSEIITPKLAGIYIFCFLPAITEEIWKGFNIRKLSQSNKFIFLKVAWIIIIFEYVIFTVGIGSQGNNDLIKIFQPDFHISQLAIRFPSMCLHLVTSWFLFLSIKCKGSFRMILFFTIIIHFTFNYFSI